jgi:hypothetical protein
MAQFEIKSVHAGGAKKKDVRHKGIERLLKLTVFFAPLVFQLLRLRREILFHTSLSGKSN